MSDSTERYHAEMEAARNEAEAAYFSARPLLDREGPPVETFRAGFERGFQKLWYRLALETAALEQACAAPLHSPLTIEQARTPRSPETQPDEVGQ